MSDTSSAVSSAEAPRFDPRQIATGSDFGFRVESMRFDEDYRPSGKTRVTTNFANLARGANRQENLRKALRMIDNRFNALAHWDNPKCDRYSVELDVVSVELEIDPEANGASFPLIEMLSTTGVDHKTAKRIAGVVGNNFSSYVRDYDFNVLLPEHNKKRTGFSTPPGFGDLQGKLFRSFVRSRVYTERFEKPPVICISASSSRTYCRTDNHHPILGVEYRQDEFSATDRYFGKMGMTVRYFMPPNSVAPLAFYFMGDLLGEYTNLELTSTVSTMETFQKIYRPEIYNANSAAGTYYRPNLSHQDFSLTQIVYDREERSRLGVEQGRFAEQHFIAPYKAILEQWSSNPLTD